MRSTRRVGTGSGPMGAGRVIGGACAAAVAFGIAAGSVEAGLIGPPGPQTIIIFSEPDTEFPFFGITAALLDQIPFLGGFEIVETRMSLTVEASNPGYDFAGTTFAVEAPLFTTSGTERIEAVFTAEDLGLVGSGLMSASVSTDVLNGPIWNDGQVFPGKKEAGKGGGDPIPAALFSWSTTGDLPPDLPLPWGTLRSLNVEIDIVPVPAPASAALLAAGGLAALRRRRS